MNLRIEDHFTKANEKAEHKEDFKYLVHKLNPENLVQNEDPTASMIQRSSTSTEH